MPVPFTTALEVQIEHPLGDLHSLSRLYTVEEGNGSTALYPCWPRGNELRVNDAREIKHTNPRFDVLLNWISAFPSPDCLEIDSVTQITSMLREGFVGLAKARCPKLKSFGIPCGDLVRDTRLDREWEIWDVRDGRIRSRAVRQLV